MMPVMRTWEAEQLFEFYKNAAHLGRAMATRAGQALPESITMARFEMLDLIAGATNPVSPLQIAGDLDLTPAAVTHHLKHLQRAGLLEIAPDPADGRAKRVSLSDSGRQAHRDCMIALFPLTTRMLSSPSAAGIADANTTLKAFAHWLENDNSSD